MIDLTNESGTEVDERSLIQLGLFALTSLHVSAEAELSIQLVDEQTMAAYHEKFMGEPGPTDVLSFPMDELRPGKDPDDLSVGVLGDVVLCPAIATQQGPATGRTGQEESEYLLIHGILHLLGFDHSEPQEKAVMFGLNDQIIEAWGSSKRDDQ
ncbi:MAG: rRNA maturation RNase YbeY [Propionibacteriaceae bacterium]|nr:rRNA maturation RNase YbeY [Propionibacteriaceae bacterium]